MSQLLLLLVVLVGLHIAGGDPSAEGAPAVRTLQPLSCFNLDGGEGGAGKASPGVGEVLSHMVDMLGRDAEALGLDLGDRKLSEIRADAAGTPGEYLLPFGTNSIWGLGWVASKLLGAVDAVLQSLGILWSDAVFEVHGVPVEAAGRLVLAQRPLLLLRTACAWVGYPDGVEHRKSWNPAVMLVRGLCAFEGPPVPGFSVSRPCASGSVLGIGGDCDCVETACRVTASPFRHPCVFVDGLDATNLRSKVETRFTFEIIAKDYLPSWAKALAPTFIPKYLVHLIIGIFLVSLAEPLSESVIFHYLLSAVLGTTVAAVFAAYVLYAFGRQFVDSLPGGRIFQNMGMFAAISAPLSAALYGSFIWNIGTQLLEGSLLFWEQGFLHYVHAGKVYFIVSALVGMWVTWYFGLFAEAEEAGPKTWVGNWTSGRANVRRVTMLLGFRYLILSCSDLEISLTIAIIICYLDTLLFWRWRVRMWLDSTPLPSRKQRLSVAEFDRICDQATRMELMKLREHIKGNMGELEKIKDHNQERMQRFLQGFPHTGAGNDEEVNRPDVCTLQ